MIILVTNSALKNFGGTQTVVISLCRMLRQRGHQVMIFSSHLGHAADLLASEKFPVVSHLRDLPFIPDIIHGQHHLETLSALLALPETPAIYYIHGTQPWEERVPIHPRILRYVNLGEVGAFRTAVEKSIPPSRMHIMENGIDFESIPPPKPPPALLRRAVFCPRKQATPEILHSLRGICAQRLIEFHHEEGWAQGTVADPQAVYRQYDLVFGTGRTALEALAAGCVVSLSDDKKLGPLLTPENIEHRRTVNYCLQLSENGIPPGELAGQLDQYSREGQQFVVDYIRKNADSQAAIDRLVEMYEAVAAEWKTAPRPSVSDELHAASEYLRALAPLLRDHEQVTRRKQENKRLATRVRFLRKRLIPTKARLKETLEAHRKLRKNILTLLQNAEKSSFITRFCTGKLVRKLEALLRSPE